MIGRIVLAGACGLLIGYERQKRSKVAGVRTHCVVACASALMMILSKYAYSDMTELYGELVKVDPSRIASGVVSGIGFLGAGMIFMNKQTTTGLTTAAGIWATAGVGMAVGAGMYVVGLASALVILLIQVVFHLNSWHRRKAKRRTADEVPEQIHQSELTVMAAKLEELGVEIIETEDAEDNCAIYTIKAMLPVKKNNEGNATVHLKAENEAF